MHVTKKIFLAAFVAIVTAATFLIPAGTIHAAAHTPAFNPKDPANAEKLRTYAAEVKSEKSLAKNSLAQVKSIAGTITSVKGTDITITVDHPEHGQPATVIVHAASADVSRVAANVPDQKKIHGADGSAQHSSRKLGVHKSGKDQSRITTAVNAGLTVGDAINVSGLENKDGTMTARRVSAHAQKGPRQTTVVTKPKA